MATGFHIDLLPTCLIEGGKAELTELTQNFYFRVIDRFNKMEEYKPIEVNKVGLLKLFGIDAHQGYDTKKIKPILENICRPLYFQHKTIHITGSVFNVWLQEEKDLYTIYFNDPFRQMLFTKKDIEILDKNKKKQGLTVAELDYWDRELKDKSTKLRLLTEAEFLGITGKYSKLMYCFIKVFSKSKEIHLKYEDFKNALNIPDSYKISDIDKRIITPTKEELENFGYIIHFNKKKTKGQGNKTTHIDIVFSYIGDEKTKKRASIQEFLKETKVNTASVEEIEITPELEEKTVKEMEAMGINLDHLKKNSSLYFATLKNYLSEKNKYDIDL